MMKFIRLSGLLALIAVILAAPAWAQQAAPSPATPAPTTPTPAAPAPAPAETTAPHGPSHWPGGAVHSYRGKVLGVFQPTVSQKEHLPELMVLVLQTPEKKYEVKLGPPAYMEKQNFPLNVGDQVEVKGARHPHPHGDTIIATEVKKGDQVLRLRDEHGRHLWEKQEKPKK